MNDTVKVIQFPHPGSEHDARAFVGDVMPWNTGDHARKFLARQGNYVTSLEGDVQRGELGFWGEWEPPTEVMLLRSRPEGQLPRYLHRVAPVPAASHHRQNTDPYVLGGFWYTNCRQLNQDHRTPQKNMQSLAPGSVILFGSQRDRGWVLDTVFVVAGHETYDFDDRPDVPDHVKACVIDPLYSGDKRYTGFRAYRGATIDNPVDGMFSFVPCSPLAENPLGFKRPHADLNLGLNPNLAMAARLVAAGPDAAKAVWQRVAEDVVDASLCLATALDAPTTSTARPPARPHTSRSQGWAARSAQGRPC